MTEMLHIAGPQVWPVGGLTGLAPIWAGYAALLIVPGPTTMLIATMTVSCGFAGTWPLRLGVALGAATQAAVLMQLAMLLPAGSSWAQWLPTVSAALLVWIAWRVTRLSPPGVDAAAPGVGRSTAPGYLCAVTNAMTASYFAASFLSLSPAADPDARAAAADLSTSAPTLGMFLSGVVILSLTSTTLISLVFGRPSIRRSITNHFGVIRWSTCLMFCLAAAAALIA